MPRQERVVAGRERADRGAQALVLGSHGGDALVAAAPDKARNLAVKGRLAVAAVADRLEQPLQRLGGKGAPLLDQRRRLVKVLRDRPADRCVRYRRLRRWMMKWSEQWRGEKRKEREKEGVRNRTSEVGRERSERRRVQAATTTPGASRAWN